MNAPAAQGPFISASGSEFAQEPVPDAWWHLYDSALLDQLVAEALAANTDLRAAQANLERSAALLDEARAQRQPSATVNFDPSYQQLSAESYLHPGSLAPAGLYDTGLSASYEIDLFGTAATRGRGRQGGRRGDQSGVRSHQDQRGGGDGSRLRRGLQHRRAARGRSPLIAAAAAKCHSHAASARGGPGPDAGFHSLLRARRTAQSAAIPSLEAQRSNALFRLAALTGRPPSEYPRSVESCVEAPRLRQPIPVGDGMELMRRRPDVREAERKLAAATARIGIATAELYPRVTLGVSAGSTGALTDIFTDPTNRYGMGLGIHWQANQSITRAQIAAAGATARGSLARFDSVVLTALRDTEGALATYVRDGQRDEDLANAQDRTREAEQEALRLYSGGKIDFLSLLDAQRSWHRPMPRWPLHISS